MTDRINPYTAPIWLDKAGHRLHCRTQVECDKAYFEDGYHDINMPETAYKPVKVKKDDDNKVSLRGLAEEMGVKVDGRWTAKRIQEEIDKKLSEIEADTEALDDAIEEMTEELEV